MVYLQTDYGAIHHADCLDVLDGLPDASVDLVVTSPPYPLVTQKEYGNVHADDYVDWFRPFAVEIRRVLRDSGSFVLNLGGVWNQGIPTRNLYHFRLLIDLCDSVGYHLAQEFLWWSPTKMPTPAEWVCVRRVRVKDGIEAIWWLSKTPHPRADNRAVLWPYSDSYRQRLANPRRDTRLCPSGHPTELRTLSDRGGAIPPNLIAAPHSDSNSRYFKYCRQQGIKPHPARFPAALPEYFIRLCTQAGDTVVDPFAGSCVTGEVCERLRRRWICCELEDDYLHGARGRFAGGVETAPQAKTYYKVPHPAYTWT